MLCVLLWQPFKLMDAHSSSSTEHQGGLWPVANKVLAIVFAGLTLYWGGALIVGGITQSIEKRSPKPVETAAPAATQTPAAAPAAAAPATPAATAAAPAVAPSSGPAQELLQKPDVTNPLGYATKEFTVKAGQLVRLTFDNSGATVPQPHNVVVGKPGSKDALIAASLTPESAANGFIPKSAEILAHTKTLQPGQKETIEFTLPAAGEYPFICSFPGHGALMNGVIKAN